MELDDVVRKIKKLLAIAEDPSASDQEIQLAAYRAEKLMFKYKLDRKDINCKTNTSHFKRNSTEGYELGVAMGSKYNFNDKRGIK
jgi:hypothetical protein